MTDRVYPSIKPISNPATLNGNSTAGNTNPSFPATKAQLYGATRPAYRPQPKPQHRHGRSCCCCCCLWTTLFLIALILLAAIAGAIFWVLYRPHRPTFSVTTVRISELNITTTPKSNSPHLDSKINLTITARNPNKRISFFYDPISVSVTCQGVDVGDGSLPALVHGKKNTSMLRGLITSASRELDTASKDSLTADLKKKSGLPLVIVMETKVRVKVGSFKSNKLRIKVTCDGIHAIVVNGKSPSSSSPLSSSSHPKCKVNLRIKIWKWTF